MEKSLINPKECQKFGIQICDESTDPHRKLGIEASKDLYTPIIMEGSTCGIVTHHTTDDGIHGCQKIILSDEYDWYQSKNFFEIFNRGGVQDKFKFSSIHKSCLEQSTMYTSNNEV